MYPFRALRAFASRAFAISLVLVPVAHARAAAPEPASADARLQALARRMTFSWASAHPLVGTSLGIAAEDGSLDVPGAAENARDLATIRAWKRGLDAIDVTGSPLRVRDDARLLRAQLVAMERTYTVYRTYEKDAAGPADSIVNAIFTQFQHLPAAPGAARDLAWDRIVRRLSGAPAYIARARALVVRPGHLFGVVGSEELAGAPDFLRGALTAAARASLSESKFATFVAARDATLASIARTKSYIDAHVAGWPENYAMGRKAYDAMLRDELLVPYDADRVEHLGRDELAHGAVVQFWLRGVARARGTPIGAPSGGGIAPSGKALVAFYRARIDELRRTVRDSHVVTVPTWLGTIDVVETPKFLQPVSPGASMNAPLLFSPQTSGFYYITPPKSLAEAAARLDPNQDFDRDRIISTAAHEAMPGHFLQLSIARRHPDFVRKIQGSGSFAEGWAFYGEEMFVDLGLYGDHLDGRYFTGQWERVRGARAVVDPELATGRWSFEHAVAYFAEQTGFPLAAAREAVAGIATQPGYVISYSVGRAQVEQILLDYLHRVGPKASLLDFHDRLLSYGTTPLAIVGPELLGDLDKSTGAVRAAANY